MLADRRVIIKEILLKFGASVGNSHKIIHDDLYSRKTCATSWVPKMLSLVHKENRLRICTALGRRQI